MECRVGVLFFSSLGGELDGRERGEGGLRTFSIFEGFACLTEGRKFRDREVFGGESQ